MRDELFRGKTMSMNNPNHLQIARLMCLWINICVHFMFILIMDE